MGLTHFPNGISSFGMPMTGAPDLWLPLDAKTYYVSQLSGSNNNNGDYDTPYLTMNQAITQVPNTSQSTNRNRGTMIYVNPGLYAEQAEIQDRRYIRMIGAGEGLSIVAGGNSSGTTFNPGGAATSPADNVGMVVAARGTIVTGFTFRGVAGGYGLYLGDGGRRWSLGSSAYTTRDCFVYGNLFDGDEFDTAARFGIVVDGCPGNINIFRNTFIRWGGSATGGGILGSSGTTQTTRHVNVFDNFFKGCRGYGVLLNAGTVISGWCTGPNNVFEDDDTTALTNPALYNATGAGINFYVGNFEACANEFSGQATDFHAGNYEGRPGNVMDHVSVA